MSALGNKGEKNQSKFKAIDINNLFKGSSVTPQKAAPANRQHGLQSLGKVSSVRRMPPPANLPSLKSENCGSDNNLVSDSSGWAKEEADSPTPASSPDAVCQQHQQQPPSSSSQPVSRAPSQRQPLPPDVNFPHPVSAPTNALWSDVMSGARRPGYFLDQQSTLFQEEFPQLASGGEEKTQMPKRGDEIREAPRGPVLDLKHQGTGPGETGVVAESDEAVMKMQLTGQPQMPFPGMPIMHMRPAMPGMPPNFRGMVMPFGFRPGFPPNCPPNFLPRGLPRSPYVNPADFRFQAGMYPMQSWNYGQSQSSDEPSGRPTIIKEKDLEQFDKLAISDGGWAAPVEDVDYSERLVFSDEEDASVSSEISKNTSAEQQSSDRSKRGYMKQQNRRHVDRERECDLHSSRESEYDQLSTSDRQMSSDSVISPSTSKEAWMSSSGHFIRLPAPPHVTGDQKHWRMEAPVDVRGSPLAFQQPPFVQRPPACVMRQDVGSGLEHDDDDEWQQRRKQQSESMMAAVERARQRREDEERRIKDEQLTDGLNQRQSNEETGAQDKDANVREGDAVDYSSAAGQKLPQRQKTEVDHMSGVQSSDSGPQLAPSSSGSASPRPPFTQSQPRMPGPRPAVAGYWPYDGRAVPAWGPVVGAPVHYMMDPRSYVWHMSQGATTRPVGPRWPGATDAGKDVQDQDENAHDGHSDQHIMNAQAYYGLVQPDHDHDSRQVRVLSEQPGEHVMSRQCSDDDGLRAPSSSTNSVSEASHFRNGSNSAENEPCMFVESGSVEPTKISGRRSGTQRTEKSSGSYGAERNRNVYHNGEGRKRTGAQKHRASHAEPNVDVTPAERDVASASVSSGDKNQASLKSSGSQQNLAHSSLSNSLSSALAYDDKTEPMSKSGKRFNYASSGRQYQGSKYQRQREARRSGVGGAEERNTKSEGHNKNLDRTAEASNKGECVKGDMANDDVVQPKQQKPKDTSNRKPKDNKDTEKLQANVNSREFVRGGRGRLRGSARGRGRGGHQDVYGSTSHREMESVSQRGSADDDINARVASAPTNSTRTTGSEQKRSGDSRTADYQSKMEDRKSSHVVGRQQMQIKVDAEDRQNGRSTAQSPSDDQHNKAQGLLQSNIGNTPPAKDTGRRIEIPAQTSRHKREFYDPRKNRGQRIRPSDARVNNVSKSQDQPDATPAKDEADAKKNVKASSQDIADTSSNVCSNEAASEQTSQRKAGPRRRRTARHGLHTAAAAASSSGSSLECNNSQLSVKDSRPGEVKDSLKSTAIESQASKTSRLSNSLPQRHKQLPASKHSADTCIGAGGIHEEWETASESSDVLRDSDVQQPSQSARGDKHANSRRDSKRGCSNQRHTQSRRGHYRDRPSADVSSASTTSRHETGSSSNAGVDTRLTRTDSDSVATVNSASGGGRHNTFPPSDPNGPNGNVHAVYRVDQVVFDDPIAIRTAFSNIFIRNQIVCHGHHSGLPYLDTYCKSGSGKTELFSESSIQSSVAQILFKANLINEREYASRDYRRTPHLPSQLGATAHLMKCSNDVSETINLTVDDGDANDQSELSSICSCTDGLDSGIELFDILDSSCRSSPSSDSQLLEDNIAVSHGFVSSDNSPSGTSDELAFGDNVEFGGESQSL